MKKRKRTKFLHEGKYAAEVEIEVLDSADEWPPYLSLQDAYKLDDVRKALRQGDIETAAKYGRVFELTPVG